MIKPMLVELWPVALITEAEAERLELHLADPDLVLCGGRSVLGWGRRKAAGAGVPRGQRPFS